LGTLNSDASNRSLTINAPSGKVTFNDVVGYLSPNHLNKSADITNLVVSAKDIYLLADISTLSEQTFNGAVVIGDNGSNGLIRTFTSQDPSITFGGTVDDSSAVTHTLNARAVSFDRQEVPSISFLGPIGSIVPLGGLVVTTETRITNPDQTVTTTPSGTLTLGGNVTTIGGQSFSTGNVTLQPPAGSTITLTSKEGRIQFDGLSEAALGNLNSQLSVISPFTLVTRGASIVPILAPPELAFAIDSDPDGKVMVADPSKVSLCESEAEDSCSKV
jgi:hypothetical protein